MQWQMDLRKKTAAKHPSRKDAPKARQSIQFLKGGAFPMKSIIAKTAVAFAIGLITATSSANAAFVQNVKNDSVRIASETWHGTVAVSRTVVHSPVIAYQAMKGERPLFSRNNERSHESVALTGHRTQMYPRTGMTAHDRSQM
jgi:hypothetical protein